MTRKLVLFVLLLGSQLMAAPTLPEKAPGVYFTGGVADAQGKMVFVSTPKGTIQAIDVKDGKVLWQTKFPGKAMALLGNKLIVLNKEAKANSLVFQILDTTKGEVVATIKEVILEEWVNWGVEYGRLYYHAATVEGNEVKYIFRAKAFYAGGARPTPEIEEQSRKSQMGVVTIDVPGATAVLKTSKEDPFDIKPNLPAVLAKVNVGTFVDSFSWARKPWQFGDYYVAYEVVVPANPKEAKLVQRKFDVKTGKAADPVTVFTGEAIQPFLTTDTKHLLILQGLPPEKLPKGDHAWRVFSIESGKEIGKVPYTKSFHESLVASNQLLAVVDDDPMKTGNPRGPEQYQHKFLTACDLTTGKENWRVEVEGVKMLLPRP